MDWPGAPQEQGDAAGERAPERSQGPGRGDQSDQHEPSLGAKDAPHFVEDRGHRGTPQDVDDVAGKDGVEGIVGIRKRGDSSPTDAVPVVRKPRKTSPRPGDHRGHSVEALGPSLRGGGGEVHQGPARAAPDVEHAVAVLHVQPGDPERPGHARDERHEPVVNRGQSGVEGPQHLRGSTRKRSPAECVNRNTGGEETGAVRNLAGAEVFAR